MYEWIEKLKEGDKVIVSSGWGEDRPGTVERITSAQVIVGNTRYRRANGRMVGANAYSRAYIYEATPERLTQARKNMLVYCLGNFKWNDYGLDDLETVWAAAKSIQPLKSPEKP